MKTEQEMAIRKSALLAGTAPAEAQCAFKADVRFSLNTIDSVAGDREIIDAIADSHSARD